MSKTTNEQQSQHLLSLMEANPDIARGFFKGSKEVLARFWRKAEEELNSMGPPSKCIAEWKQVWADQKKYVLQKASHNIQEKKCTGGGPNKEQKFSSAEEAIFNLIGMKSFVEGVPCKTFGLQSPTNKEVAPLASDILCLDDTADTVEGVPDLRDKKVLKPRSINLKNAGCHKKDDQKDLARSVVEAELDLRRELLETIKLVVVTQKDQVQTTRKIYRSLYKMYEQNKNHFKQMESLKREEIQEMRRHNAFMENLRVKEVEDNLEKYNIQKQMQEYSE